MRKSAIISGGTILALLTSATHALAQGNPVELCPPGAACNATTDPGTIIGNVLNFLFIIGAVLAVVFLIWGGIKWITAGGDKTKVQSARDTIIGAIIGLVVAFAAFFIINFVLKILFGASIEELQFDAIFK